MATTGIGNKSILFNAASNRSRQQTFACDGFEKPVIGTVYPRSSLRWHGVPLGGLGTGYVTWDVNGRFGQCTIFNQVPAQANVPDLKMIPFRLTVEGKTWEMAMRGDDGRGDLLDMNYFGHFPMADVRFLTDGPVAVEIRAFGPFIPGDAVESNTPAIVFEAYLTNTSAEQVDAVLSFTPPTPPRPATRFTETVEEEWKVLTVRHPWDKAKPAIGNSPVEHEMAVAVQTGIVSTEGGTLGARFAARLEPGKTAVTRFILAWHQPYIRDVMYRAEKLKYAERFTDVSAVMRYALEKFPLWLERIIRWQSAVYRRDELPEQMREALVNSFYSICKNSHWISKWRPDDWFPEEGLFVVNESLATCPLSETLPCHYFGSFPVMLFFPELERTTIESYRHFQLKSGEVPFALANGFGVRTPFYQAQHTNGIGEYIEIIFRLWRRTGDAALLSELYPSAKAALDYLEFLDTDGDGLVNEHSHALPGERFPANVPWDQWPQFGTSAYTAMKSLTACIALERMALESGDPDTARRCRDRIDVGRAQLEKQLWNGSYYNLSTRSSEADGSVTDNADTDCLLAQITGAWAAAILGLEGPVPEDRVKSCIRAIKEHTSEHSQFGYVLAAHSDGSLTYSNYTIDCDFPRDIWPLFNFIYTACCLIFDEQREHAWEPTLMVLRSLFHTANAMPWGWPCCLSSVNGWEGHGHDYQDPLAIWTVPMALAGRNIATGSRAGSLVDDILTAAASI